MTQELEERVRNGLETLYDLFAKAPWLGSLIDPRRTGDNLFREGFEKLEPLLPSILSTADTDDAREMAVTAQGIAKAVEVLATDFSLVVTNVPYLGRGKQHEDIRQYTDIHFSKSKFDLASAFIERCSSFSGSNGVYGIVCPQSWLFLSAYKKLRAHVLTVERLIKVVRLGARAFESISGEVVSVCLAIGAKSRITTGNDKLSLIDVSSEDTPKKKSQKLERAYFYESTQFEQMKNPDHRIVSDELGSTNLLSEYASTSTGMQTFDLPRFVLKFWEFEQQNDIWEPSQSTVEKTTTYGGLSDAVRWEQGKGSLWQYMQDLAAQGYKSGIWKAGSQFWGRRGVLVSLMGDLPATVYLGTPFNQNTGVLIPKNDDDFKAIWSFASSPDFGKAVRLIDQSLKVTNATIAKIPFDLIKWKSTADSVHPNGLPLPNSGNIDQWLFDGIPCNASQPLASSTIRFMGYRWPRQTGSTLMDVPALAADGLEAHADTDGIVGLIALKGEAPAEHRLNALLSDAFGTEWSATKLTSLMAATGFAGKSLDDWLRNGFFEQHCMLFHQRPFIWHIWDGRHDGFHALINYHRLAAPNGEGRNTLDKLIYSYLGDWIDRQRADVSAGIEGADARFAHAVHLRQELIKIREGEPPHDTFVRWKPLHRQAIGWEPDIDDGVRLNIRPFMTARPLGAKAKSACILRTMPKIKWQKDRGKEPTRDKKDYPWFWGWDGESEDFAGGAGFGGNRWNDLHYSRAFKQAARDRRRK